LTHDQWRVKLQAVGARYQPVGVDRGNFTGWLASRNICGFDALELSCNAPRIERTPRDTRLDDISHYYVLFQCAGRMQLEQNDRTSVLNPGDVALVDSSRPVTYLSQTPRQSHWLSLHLNRKSLASYLGFEPKGGQSRNGEALAAVLLRELVSMTTRERHSGPAGAYMSLAVFDLVGALFTDVAHVSISPYSDKLFLRACDIIGERFNRPEFGPSELAAEMRISLRYLQTLFAARGDTCSAFIRSSRLNHATNQLRRHALVETPAALQEIAYSSGFLDYNYFARLFRRRFGHSPSAHGPAAAGSEETGLEPKTSMRPLIR
jgi:AraC family transcriptional regulator, positive regulator of tynA and feaB